MALTASEIATMKRELGFNLLSVGADPYIGVSALFEAVIVPNMTAEAETVIRDILEELANVASSIANARASAGVKKVDEIEFFGGGTGRGDGKDAFVQLFGLREYWRTELASVLGIERRNASAGADASVY